MKKQSLDRKRRCEAQVASGGLYWASTRPLFWDFVLVQTVFCIIWFILVIGSLSDKNQWPVGLKWYIFELNLNIIDIWNSAFLDRNFQIWWHPRAITTSTCHEKSLTGNKRWFEISFMETPETLSRQSSILRSPAASRVYFLYSWATSSIRWNHPENCWWKCFQKKKLTKTNMGKVRTRWLGARPSSRKPSSRPT